MKSAIVLFLVVLFMFSGYLLNNWLQKLISPRRSFSRLLLYFLLVMILVFLASYVMVYVITTLYPDELIK